MFTLVNIFGFNINLQCHFTTGDSRVLVFYILEIHRDQLEIDSYLSQNDIAHSEFYISATLQKRFEKMAYEEPGEAGEGAEENTADAGTSKLRLKR